MAESCATCRHRYRLEQWDYSGKGCKHTDMDGYVCMALANEGVAAWMSGISAKESMCEAWEARK